MAQIAPSELIINDDGSVFHLHLRPEELADIVIVAGDPGRIALISSFFDEGSIEFSKNSREFFSCTGKYKGKRITALSTGIGTDNIDIVMTELDALANIDFTTREPKPEHKSLTILRIGSCGCVQPDIPLGGFVFTEMSIGMDGLLHWYANNNSVLEHAFVQEFVSHMKWQINLPMPYIVRSSPMLKKRFEGSAYMGMTISAPGFYGPQGRVVRLGLTMPDFIESLESFRCDGQRITNIEMESSALCGLSRLLGHEAATICCVVANRYRKESQPNYKPLIYNLIKTSLDNLVKEI